MTLLLDGVGARAHSLATGVRLRGGCLAAVAR